MPSFICMPFFACNRQIDLIDRRQCNLQTIPGDLERYARSLEELLLDMNHINSLPKSLFRLHKLQRLGLSDNDIHRLPPEVSGLQNLIELNLSRNDISDLPEELRICQNLQVLDISSNPIARLPDSITLCTSLTQLSLNDISLTKLPQDIGKLISLKSLEVRENHLRALPVSISELKQLQRLDLGQNELDELPNEIGFLRSLQELYIDENSLEKLPDSILQCTRLEQLDLTSNRLFQLPEDIGDLSNLVDLTASHNCIRELPSSIGRLKRLFILKMDDNMIGSVTPAIGGCIKLNELYLQQNPITELPSSIGNLKCLQTLNLDRCQLRQLPSLIGECQSLNVLQVRNNQLEELPMEIGKLAKLKVFDVCNNMLTHLPYTINVLRELQALWLSENQSQALVRLQQETDSRSGIKILTCYLLPQVESQKSGNSQPPNSNKSSGFVGGPKVHFGVDEAEREEVSADKAQQFERKNTPHPKPSSSSTSASTSKHHKKQHVDGHIAAKVEEHPKTIVLSGSVKKISQDHSSVHAVEPGCSTSTAVEQRSTLPRSALKYPSRMQPSSEPQHQQPIIELQKSPKQPAQKQQKAVIFNNGKTTSKEESSSNECRLKRVNTPHYKSQRAAAAAAAAESGDNSQHQANRRQLPKTPANAVGEPVPVTTGIDQNDGMRIQAAQGGSSREAIMLDRKRVVVRRGDGGGGGLGLSIAGGIESTPFIGNDSGIFISKLVSGGAAERAGLRPGDKVLEINGTSMLGKRHQSAVDCIQQSVALELLIERRRSGAIQKLFPGPATSIPSNNLSNNKSTPASVPRITNTPASSQNNNSSFSTPASTKTYVQPSSQSPPHHPQSSFPTLSSFTTTPAATAPSPHLTSATTANTSFSSLPVAQNEYINLTSKQTSTNKNPPPNSIIIDGSIEDVVLARESTSNSLGLSIVGGIDHCSHPFGSSSKPGVFISKITHRSPAAICGRLRIGDRILKVNDADISCAKHNEAVEILKRTGCSIRLTVCHEPQPKGLRSVIIQRQGQEPLGLSICGGIGGAPVNPKDSTDEGIFIERIEDMGPAAISDVGLCVGLRILEVNDDSLLGCTKEEAAQIFRRSSPGAVRLLICDGLSLPSVNSAPRPQISSITVATSPTSLNAPTLTDIGLPLSNNNCSQSNLTEIEKGSKIVSEMLSSSTPIEYSPVKEPKIIQNNYVNSENMQQKQQTLSNQTNPQQSKIISTSNSTNFSILPPSPAKILTPVNDFVNHSTFAPNQQATNSTVLDTTKVDTTSIEQNNPKQISDPSFSSKLKLFEHLQSANSVSTNNNNLSMSQRLPGIPPKKPLISAQEMERLREVGYNDKRINALNDFSPQEEHLNSTVEQLDSFLLDGRSDQPSIIRTKKVEIRAEKDRIASSPFMVNGTNEQQPTDTTPLSRDSPSLSQKAAEIEKRELLFKLRACELFG
uniref:PDZ domain-containing protein n=1 Tax=Meloidogyne hapla TaxID=6305 RepID=A0A1I8B8K4_MELHA